MIDRTVRTEIETALKRQSAVALIGPRQTGKTTLALEIARTRPSTYLDLEDPNSRNYLQNPVLFFENEEDRLVILDEIHKMPELFPILRGVIDKGRRKNKGKGRFLILGSASIDLLHKSGETLAGRISYINISPFSAVEIKDTSSARNKLWLRGGFPDSYLAKSDEDSFAFRKDFIRSYLERDVSLFSPRIPLTTLRRLWLMLAHRQGCLLNASELARSLDVSTQSVNRYIDLLSDMLFVRRLLPYRKNVGKRLIKSPKIYICDSGIVHTLLGIKTYRELMGHPVCGNSWEGYVLETLLSVMPWHGSVFFYRTSVGAEIDLIIEFKNNILWAIEIKKSLSPKVTKGFHQVCSDLTPRRAFVVYEGEKSYPLSKKITALSLREMAEKLKKS